VAVAVAVTVVVLAVAVPVLVAAAVAEEPPLATARVVTVATGDAPAAGEAAAAMLTIGGRAARLIPLVVCARR